MISCEICGKPIQGKPHKLIGRRYKPDCDIDSNEYTEETYTICNECYTQLSQNTNKVTTLHKNTDVNKDVLYANWCESIMDKIEEIAKQKYPDITVWCDTGSRWNVCMNILQKIQEDLK